MKNKCWIKWIFCALILLSNCLAKSSFIDVCKLDCQRTFLPFPLIGTEVRWKLSKYFTGNCNSSCHVNQCIDGCDKFLSSLSCVDQCPSSDSCFQGCKRSNFGFLAQVQDFINSINMQINPNSDSHSISLHWRVAGSLSFVQNITHKEAITFLVQSRISSFLSWHTQDLIVNFGSDGSANTIIHSPNGAPSIMPYQSYEFRLIAVSKWGDVAIGQTFSIFTPPDTTSKPFHSPILSIGAQLFKDQYLLCWNTSTQRKAKFLVQVSKVSSSSVRSQEVTSYCFIFSQLEVESKYIASVSEVNIAGQGPKLEQKFILENPGPQPAQALIFANKTTVMQLADDADFSVLERPLIHYAIGSSIDEITALSVLSVSKWVIGTKAGHLIMKDLSNDDHANTFYRNPGGVGPAIGDISFDWIQQKLYFLTNNIEVSICPTDYNRCDKPLVLKFINLLPISQIEVDPFNGYLYIMLKSGRLYRTGVPSVEEFSQNHDISVDSLEIIDLPFRVSASAIALDLYTANLLVSTVDGSVFAYNLVTNSISDVRHERIFKNAKVHSNATKLIAHEGRIFWISDPCPKSPARTCLYSEEEQSGSLNEFGQSLLHLYPYLLPHGLGDLVDLAYLKKLDYPLFVSEPSDVSIVCSKTLFKVTWKKPGFLPFQYSKVEWRSFKFDVKVPSQSSPNRAFFKKLGTQETVYEAVGKPNNGYIAQVRACWSNACSNYAQKLGKTFKNLGNLDFLIVDKQGTTFNMDILGKYYKTDSSYKSHALNAVCSEFDEITERLFWCSKDEIRFSNIDGSEYTLAKVPGVNWLAMLPLESLLFMATPYSLQAVRLTGSFYKSYIECSPKPMKDCEEILGLTVNRAKNEVIYLKKELTGNSIVATSLNVDGTRSEEMGRIDSKKFPRLRQLHYVSGKFIFLAENGKIGIMEKNLKNLVFYNLDMEISSLIEITSHQPKPLFTSISFINLTESSNGKFSLEWAGDSPSLTDPASILYNVNVYLDKRNKSLPPDVASVTPSKAIRFTDVFTDRFGSASILSVKLQALNGYGEHQTKFINLTTPALPPTQPRNVTIYVSRVGSPHGNTAVTATIDVVWIEPELWHGTPDYYKVSCYRFESGKNGVKVPLTNPAVNRIPADTTQFQIRFLDSDVFVHCDVSASNRESKIAGKWAMANARTSELNPYVNVIALSKSTGSLVTFKGGKPRLFTDNNQLKTMDYLGEFIYAIQNFPHGSTEKEIVRIKINDFNMQQKLKLDIDSSEDLKLIVCDWVAKRLIVATRKAFHEVPIMDILSTDSLKTRKLATINAQEPISMAIEPLNDTLYFVFADKLLYSIDLKSGEVTDLSQSYNCLRNLEGGLASTYTITSKYTSPSLLVAADGKILKLDWKRKQCQTMFSADSLRGITFFEYGKSSTHGFSIVSHIAVGHNKYFLGGNNGLVELSQDGTEVDYALSGGTNDIISINSQLRPFPHASCLRLPGFESLSFNVSTSGKSGIKVMVAPWNADKVCERSSQPAVRYMAFVRKSSFVPRNQGFTCGKDCVMITSYFNNTIIVPNLEPYRKYNVYVSWGNAYTKSVQPSKGQSFQTSYGYPSAPRNVLAIGMTPDKFLLTWLLPKVISASPLEELRYVVYQHSVQQIGATAAVQFQDPVQMDGYFICVKNPCWALVGDIKHLAPMFSFKIHAVHKSRLNNVKEDMNGRSADSDIVMNVPHHPGIVSAQNLTSTSLVIRWTPTNADNATIGLVMQYREHGMVDFQWLNATDTLLPPLVNHTRKIDNLRPASSYEIRYIVRYKTPDYSPYGGNTGIPERYKFIDYSSDPVAVKTSAESPSTPVNVGYDIDDDGFTLSWQPPEHDGGAVINYYLIEYRKSEDEEWKQISSPILHNSSLEKYSWKPKLEDRLPQDMDTLQSYQFRVSAVNRAGSSKWAYKWTTVDSAKPADSSSLAPIIIAVSLLAILFIIIIIALCFIMYRRSHRKPKHLYPNLFNLTEMESPGIDAVRQIPPEELRILPHVPRGCITIARMLGKGAFGEVFEGLACNLPRIGPKSVRVAIKTLRQGSQDTDRVKFLKEAIMMGNFDHANIVKLLGVCLDSEPHWIILELMEGGDLLTYLRSVRPSEMMPSQVSMKDLVSIMFDVGKGCSYLEQNHHVHRDLAARNCLISTRDPTLRIVKIADFGLARDVYQEDYYRVDGQGLLPIRWMAPESMIDGLFTVKTDVWSYGVLLWEVMTLGQQPYHGRTNWDVLNYVRIGGRLEKPEHCPEEIYDLMLQCWAFRPDERPSFAQLIPTLDNIVNMPRFTSESPFPPVFLPGAGVNGGVVNPGFEGSSRPTSSEMDHSGGGKVNIFTTDNSAKFQRNNACQSLRSQSSNQSTQSGRRKPFTFRSLRKTKKVIPPRPPSKEELQYKPQPRPDSMTSTSTTVRPESGLSSGGESYTTSRYGYEVPLMKGLTNMARNQMLANRLEAGEASGNSNSAYSPTSPSEEYYQTKELPEKPVLTTFGDPNVHRMNSFTARYVPSPSTSSNDVRIRSPKRVAPLPPTNEVTVTGPSLYSSSRVPSGNNLIDPQSPDDVISYENRAFDDKRPSQV